MKDKMIGKILVGKYRIDEFIRRGGMGAVYRATHQMLAKPVAIKLIKPELVTTDDTIQRFHREARAASHLSHPNIVSVYDLGRAEDGTLYIAMELVGGENLKELIKKQGPMDPGRVVRIAGAIANALAHAHKNHVIHRDLKPQNIMITRDTEGQETPKLLDFGIAKTFETDSTALTSTGMVLGTPQYMSPEQAEGKAVDVRSDLYALGIILYEMLVGKVPFDAPSVPAVLIKHLNESPQPPSKLRSDIPSSLEHVVLRCLAKDPNDRFSSAEELSAALATADQTVAASVGGPTIGIPALSPPPQAAATAVATPKPVSTAVPPPAPPSEADTTIRAKRSRSLPLVLGLVTLLVLAFAGVILIALRSREDAESSPRADSLASSQPPLPEVSRDARTDSSENPPPTQVGAGPATPSHPPSADSAGPSHPTTQENFTDETPSPAAPESPQTPPPIEPPPAVAAPPEKVTLPTHPPVSVSCQGVADGCAAVISTLQQRLRDAGLPLVHEDRAEIVVSIFAEEVESRAEEQFGTTFVVRTYSIEVTGEASRFGEIVGMPPPEVLSFDTRFGKEKLNERARVLSSNVIEKILVYWSGKSE